MREAVLIERHGATLVMTLNRPERRNAVRNIVNKGVDN